VIGDVAVREETIKGNFNFEFMLQIGVLAKLVGRVRGGQEASMQV
jgi:hypothetical protein